MDRRDFLKAAIVAAIAPLVGASRSEGAATGEMQYRTLGRTGEKVSIVGVGGYHIGLPKTDDEAIKIVRTAIDGGVNFMDNCWDYNGGLSETRMGKALRDGYRKKVFLMTKIDGRDAKTAASQMDQSLQRLQTDHIDLIQFHEIIRVSDSKRIFAPGGGIEAVMAAKKAGKVRFIGFTGHKNPDIHIKTLNAAYQHDKFLFDAVQMPLNVMDAHFHSFATAVVPQLVKHNIGVIGMKPMGSGIILKTKAVTPVECLHYAMNLPTSVVVTGCDSMPILQQALDAARSFRPMTDAQVSALLAKTADLAKNGQYEPYKLTHQFDATFQNPQWLGPPEHTPAQMPARS
jgi:uncharacterized protein